MEALHLPLASRVREEDLRLGRGDGNVGLERLVLDLEVLVRPLPEQLLRSRVLLVESLLEVINLLIL